MKINDNNYAYPVLSEYNDDYVDSKFDVEFKQGIDDVNRIYIDVNVELDNLDLKTLIQRDSARLVLHIEGSHTSQRNLITLNDYNYRFYVDDKKYSGSIELNVFIVANKKLYDYSNSKFNENIFGQNYSVKMIEKGMILASTITQIIDINSEKDQLKNISSIIKVGLTKTHKDMMVDYNDNFILIQLPEQEFLMYKQLSRAKYADLVLTSVIYPALIFILEKMKKVDDQSLTWYKVIAKQIEKLEYSVDDIGVSIESYKLAHMILGRPLNRALHPRLLEE